MMSRKLLGMADKIANLRDADIKKLNQYLLALEFDYDLRKKESGEKTQPKIEKAPRNLLNYADKIAIMKDANIDKINGYLKALDSIWRISLTDGEQMRRAGQSMKKGITKILGSLKDGEK